MTFCLGMKVEEGLVALRAFAEERGITLGPVVEAPDPVIQGIVKSWPE